MLSNAWFHTYIDYYDIHVNILMIIGSIVLDVRRHSLYYYYVKKIITDVN